MAKKEVDKNPQAPAPAPSGGLVSDVGKGVGLLIWALTPAVFAVKMAGKGVKAGWWAAEHVRGIKTPHRPFTQRQRRYRSRLPEPTLFTANDRVMENPVLNPGPEAYMPANMRRLGAIWAANNNWPRRVPIEDWWTLSQAKAIFQPDGMAAAMADLATDIRENVFLDWEGGRMASTRTHESFWQRALSSTVQYETVFNGVPVVGQTRPDGFDTWDWPLRTFYDTIIGYGFYRQLLDRTFREFDENLRKREKAREDDPTAPWDEKLDGRTSAIDIKLVEEAYARRYMRRDRESEPSESQDPGYWERVWAELYDAMESDARQELLAQAQVLAARQARPLLAQDEGKNGVIAETLRMAEHAALGVLCQTQAGALIAVGSTRSGKDVFMKGYRDSLAVEMKFIMTSKPNEAFGMAGESIPGDTYVLNLNRKPGKPVVTTEMTEPKEIIDYLEGAEGGGPKVIGLPFGATYDDLHALKLLGPEAFDHARAWVEEFTGALRERLSAKTSGGPGESTLMWQTLLTDSLAAVLVTARQVHALAGVTGERMKSPQFQAGTGTDSGNFQLVTEKWLSLSQIDPRSDKVAVDGRWVTPTDDVMAAFERRAANDRDWDGLVYTYLGQPVVERRFVNGVPIGDGSHKLRAREQRWGTWSADFERIASVFAGRPNQAAKELIRGIISPRDYAILLRDAGDSSIDPDTFTRADFLEATEASDNPTTYRHIQLVIKFLTQELRDSHEVLRQYLDRGQLGPFEPVDPRVAATYGSAIWHSGAPQDLNGQLRGHLPWAKADVTGNNVGSTRFTVLEIVDAYKAGVQAVIAEGGHALDLDLATRAGLTIIAEYPEGVNADRVTQQVADGFVFRGLEAIGAAEGDRMRPLADQLSRGMTRASTEITYKQLFELNAGRFLTLRTGDLNIGVPREEWAVGHGGIMERVPSQERLQGRLHGVPEGIIRAGVIFNSESVTMGSPSRLYGPAVLQGAVTTGLVIAIPSGPDAEKLFDNAGDTLDNYNVLWVQHTAAREVAVSRAARMFNGAAVMRRWNGQPLTPGEGQTDIQAVQRWPNRGVVPVAPGRILGVKPPKPERSVRPEGFGNNVQVSAVPPSAQQVSSIPTSFAGGRTFKVHTPEGVKELDLPAGQWAEPRDPRGSYYYTEKPGAMGAGARPADQYPSRDGNAFLVRPMPPVSGAVYPGALDDPLSDAGRLFRPDRVGLSTYWRGSGFLPRGGDLTFVPTQRHPDQQELTVQANRFDDHRDQSGRPVRVAARIAISREDADRAKKKLARLTDTVWSRPVYPDYTGLAHVLAVTPERRPARVDDLYAGRADGETPAVQPAGRGYRRDLVEPRTSKSRRTRTRPDAEIAAERDTRAARGPTPSRPRAERGPNDGSRRVQDEPVRSTTAASAAPAARDGQRSAPGDRSQSRPEHSLQGSVGSRGAADQPARSEPPADSTRSAPAAARSGDEPMRPETPARPQGPQSRRTAPRIGGLPTGTFALNLPGRGVSDDGSSASDSQAEGPAGRETETKPTTPARPEIENYFAKRRRIPDPASTRPDPERVDQPERDVADSPGVANRIDIARPDSQQERQGREDTGRDGGGR